VATDEAKEPLTLPEVLAQQLALIREREGLTQDDLAREARRCGLAKWKRTTIAAIENGRRPLALGEYILLCLPLNLNLSDWLAGVPDREWIRLADDATIEAVALRGMLESDEEARARSDLWNIPRTRPGNTDMDELRAFMAAGEAEEHLARSLNPPMAPEELIRRSFALWGKTLTDERDERVHAQGGSKRPIRSIQALRGHVTRQLVTELLGDSDQESSPEGDSE
jgi:transcriptional regulator with XRE-family HTH domain